MRTFPVNFLWRPVELVDDGDGTALRVMAMVPQPRYDNVCKRQFAEGEVYPMEVVEERSMASHRQFFAALKSAYDNLPEKIAARWPSPEHYRKWCLIECGYFTEKDFDMASEKHAKALATFVRTEDSYARITIHGTKVIVRKAESQAIPAMKKARFEESKKAVLELADSMTGVEPGTHWREGGMHA
jgi:hypothetical protein